MVMNMTSVPIFLTLFAMSKAANPTENCKDILQDFLAGRISSAVGTRQSINMNRAFQNFTHAMRVSMAEFKEKTEADIRMIKEKKHGNGGVVFTRWGKKTCPSNAELVHSGYVGGSLYNNRGAAVEPLCLPREPEWGVYRDGTDGQKAYIYGAEYQTNTISGYMRNFHDHDVPCAVCLIPKKSIVKMFPAKKTCYEGWTLEYKGYLMAGYFNHPAATSYTCVDEHPDTIHGGRRNEDGYLFYQVEAICGSLKCPPYVRGRELVCAVCSKD